MRACLDSIRRKLISHQNLAFTGVHYYNLRVNPGFSSAELSTAAESNKENLAANKAGLAKQISLAPNPSGGTVYILYHTMAVKKQMSITVYSSWGQKLKKVFSQTPINQIDLGNVAEGVYYITITVDNVSVSQYIIKAAK